MDLIKLQKSIVGGQLPSLCIFTGQEIELQNVYLKQMGKYTRVDTVGSVYSKLTSKLLSDTENIYVVRDDMDFAKNEKAWTNLASKIKNGTLVLQFTKLDKKTKFYKQFKQDIIEFNPMTTKQLIKILKGKVNAAEQDLAYLIEQCNNDYNTILNELDKMHRLGYTQINSQVVDKFIYKSAEPNVFKLIDYIIARKPRAAYQELQLVLKDGASPMGIFSLLHSTLHRCILVEGYRGHNKISDATGLPWFQCKNILDNNAIPPNELLQALRTVQKYHQGIMTGAYEQNVAVECCITEILY